MADQYFIKRGDKVHGPYTGEQISSGIKSKKLTANDEVSVSENGPWNPLQAFYDTILNKKAAQVQVGSQAPNENQMRIVQQYQLKKNAFGKYTVKYKCPYCKEGLSSGEQELREGDHCPECRRPFRFSVDAIAQIESERQQNCDEKEQKSEEKRQHQLERQQEKRQHQLERQQEKERQQQRKEEDRRHVEQARLKIKMADNADEEKRRTQPKNENRRSKRGLLVLVAVVGVLVAVVGVVLLAGAVVVALYYGGGHGNPVANLLSGAKVKKVTVKAGEVTITDKEDGLSHLKLECNNGLVIDVDWERNSYNDFGYDIYEPEVNMDYNRLAVMLMARVVIASYLKGEYD